MKPAIAGFHFLMIALILAADLERLQKENETSDGIETSSTIESQADNITDRDRRLPETPMEVEDNPGENVHDDEEVNPHDDDKSLVYITNQVDRTKRFYKYKWRMVGLLNHLSATTGCYGILYLRRYESLTSG